MRRHNVFQERDQVVEPHSAQDHLGRVGECCQRKTTGTSRARPENPARRRKPKRADENLLLFFFWNLVDTPQSVRYSTPATKSCSGHDCRSEGRVRRSRSEIDLRTRFCFWWATAADVRFNPVGRRVE